MNLVSVRGVTATLPDTRETPYSILRATGTQFILMMILIIINPWRQSPEEPRPTEAVAARWQYSGPFGQQSAYPSTLILVFLTGFRYFSFKQLPNCPHEAGWTPFQTLYFQKKILGYSPESNPGPLGWQSDVLTIIPNRRSMMICQNFMIFYCVTN